MAVEPIVEGGLRLFEQTQLVQACAARGLERENARAATKELPANRRGGSRAQRRRPRRASVELHTGP